MSSSESSVLQVRVRPGARKTELRCDEGRGWLVSIAAPPVDGRANEELVRFLGREVLGVGRDGVRIRAGGSGRDKLLDVDLPASEVESRLRVYVEQA